MEIVEVQTPADMEKIKELFREYFRFLADEHGVDLSYQGIEDELACLPGKFAAPEGRLKLAVEAGQPTGCAALRPIDQTTCELKRMYVRPPFRGLGAGRKLAETLIDEAIQIGYHIMRLDTGDFLSPAIELYQSLGFNEIRPYYEVPEDIRKITVFMELDLNRSHQ